MVFFIFVTGFLFESPSLSLSYPTTPSPIAPSPLSSSSLSPSMLIVIDVVTHRTVDIIVARRAIAVKLVVVVIHHHRRHHCRYPIAHLAVATVVMVVVIWCQGKWVVGKKGIKRSLGYCKVIKPTICFWLFRGDDHLFWQFCEGYLIKFSDASFVRHLNLIDAIVRSFNSCFI